MIELLLIPLMSLADRARGTKSYLVILPALLMGFAASSDITTILIIAGAYIAGEATGWGETIGSILANRKMNHADLDTFQKLHKSLGEKQLLAITVRGLIWATPIALAAYYTTGEVTALILFISILIPFVISPYIIRKLIKVKNDPQVNLHAWRKEIDVMLGKMEFLRGGLAGLIIAIYLNILSKVIL